MMNDITALAALSPTVTDTGVSMRVAGARPAIAEDHIDIQNLSIRYGSHTVVDDVSLCLPRNTVTALIGPSGCGKSSILHCLNRLNDLVPCCQVSGSVRFSWLDNEEMAKNPILLRRHVGMLFQRPNPFPFSIWKNMEFALKQHGIKARAEVMDRIASALQEVGLWDEVMHRLDASALALSGGQKPRWPLQIPPPVATPNSPRQDVQIMTTLG